MDNEELQNDANVIGETAPKPVTEEVDVKPMLDVTKESSLREEKNVPTVTDKLPSIKRAKFDEVSVDDNFNFEYVLKNGKKLLTTVVKPGLRVSTELSDKEVKISSDDNGNDLVILNKMGVYSFIMKEIIKVIQVDDKPMNKVTFDHLTEVGMTKGELDDFMNVINTFYLS
ncbi:hypothetical protein GPK34_02200 [Secundilactobacillus kimchicus]|uniref:Uncharacterized protein n=1 Tax=Secundilactobacillus kimchicus JCM 15530 TaxID=1302272 RepID=A0A0R1HMY0_9LACO|nr:hypothetical protein [Secundilactobacillus kimchicus]KRK48190.1 hypothetical protein FC96_GL001929 [Secundilactobacillus kimchicus JCM 15530]MBT9670850.1 hypothetical protein [Secundilactobacillus kimchicus]